MEITIYRDAPHAVESRLLPAATYNLTRVLLARGAGAVFVPIRAMQFLAILDAEEILFVDHLNKSEAEIAWRRFRPQARDALDAPVPYEVVYYREEGLRLMARLQPEFPKALAALARKDRPVSPARVLKFERPAEKPEP